MLMSQKLLQRELRRLGMVDDSYAPPLRKVSLVLGHEDILALPTTGPTGIVLVPPQAGKILLYVTGSIFLDASAGQYTNVSAGDDSGFYFAYGEDNDVASVVGGSCAGIFDALIKRVALGSNPEPVNVLSDDLGLTFVLWNDGDFEDGHADNSLKLTMLYTLIDA